MKLFFGPHSGHAGCPEPLDDKVQTLANELDGLPADLDDIADRIQFACPEGRVRIINTEPKGFGMIVLELQDGEYRNNWRLIYFRDL